MRSIKAKAKDQVKYFIMCGLPGAGKSTIVQQLRETWDAYIVSKDEINKMLYGKYTDINFKDSFIVEGVVDSILMRLTVQRPMQSIIIDMCHVTIRSRAQRINLLHGMTPKPHITLMWIDAPLELCIDRRVNIDNKGCDGINTSWNWTDIITDMHTNFEVPTKDEGFDDIKHITHNDRSI